MIKMSQIKGRIKQLKVNIKQFFTPTRTLVAISVAFAVVISILILIFIEYRHNLNSFGPVWDMLLERPRVFFYSALIIFAIIVFFAGIFGNVFVAGGVTASIFILLMYTNYNKIIYRDAPLLPEDFGMVTESGSLIGMVGILSLIINIIAAAAIVFSSILLHRFINRKLPAKFSKKSRIITRVCLVAVAATFLIAGTHFIRNTKGNRVWNDFLRSEFVAWNQTENYRRNGFLIGFIYNLQSRRMEEPANYSRESIEQISKKYQTVADRENKDRIDLADEDINIIFVMNESFFDATKVTEFYPFESDHELLPNLHRLQSQNPHGNIFTSEFAGGTANVEFEALTGFSNFFTSGIIPYTHMVSRNNNFPSFARFLGERGYRTVGMHPYGASMYKRDIVYQNFGFDAFIDQTGFTYQDSIRPDDREYISDYSAYRQLLYQLNSTDDNQFIFMVTMQNHLPFHDTPANARGFNSTANVEPHINQQINNYLESLHESDLALGFLVDELNNLGKKVVLVFWGDHLPYQYDNLPYELRQSTPILFYANFDLENQIEVNTITPNYITTLLLDLLGVEKSPFHFMLDDMKKKYPIFAHFYFQDQYPAPSIVLTEYELINFDVLSGRRFAQSTRFFK
ncbi:LTA synthase family protein [Candidatus Saccharibacteria bacterium]|nr:LTA synthase family protein [Candidatus Saccharibacteria bacterium]